MMTLSGTPDEIWKKVNYLKLYFGLVSVQELMDLMWGNIWEK